MQIVNDRPGTEELYICAGNASNLRVQAERGGSADVVIAAGWSRSRLGMALLRLHTEWDAAEKPRKPTKLAIEALALTLPRKVIRANNPALPDLTRAAALANGWHLQELRTLVGKLHMLPDVRREVALQAGKWRIEGATDVAASAIMYWLDQTCHPCAGLKWAAVPGTPTLSSRPCKVCRGSGLAVVPHGQAGKRLCNYMDDCVSRAQQSLRNRLRNTH